MLHRSTAPHTSQRLLRGERRYNSATSLLLRGERGPEKVPLPMLAPEP